MYCERAHFTPKAINWIDLAPTLAGAKSGELEEKRNRHQESAYREELSTYNSFYDLIENDITNGN